tara:strand:+ start:79 stop:1023 length:945 start_codon:yes stop_codon:yes gene_type:complete
MEKDTNKVSYNYKSDEIDLKELFSVLWSSKYPIAGVTFVFLLATIIYSLYQPNFYQSSALLSPIEEQNDISAAMKSYNNLANFAGINLPSQTSISKSQKALDKLGSLSFFTENILPNIFLPDLMAVDSWDPKSNNISYNSNDFSNEKQLWVREYKFPQTQVPSAQESYKVFKERLTVVEDSDSGFITVSIKHQSPYIAKAWTELLISEINSFFRIKDQAEAQLAIDFLNAQIAQTNFKEVKQVIAQLLQQKTQQLSIIEVSDFYVFEYIDPPAVMEEKYEPKRLLMLIIGTLLGLSFGLIVSLIRYYFFQRTSR